MIEHPAVIVEVVLPLDATVNGIGEFPIEGRANPLFPFLMRGDGGILTKGEKVNS